MDLLPLLNVPGDSEKPTNYSKSIPLWKPTTNPLQAAANPIAITSLEVKPCVLFPVPAYSNPLQPATLHRLLGTQSPRHGSQLRLWGFTQPCSFPAGAGVCTSPFREENTLQPWGRASLLDPVFISPQGFSLVILKWLLALQRKIKRNTEIIFWKILVIERYAL